MARYLETVGWNAPKAGATYAQRGIAARKWKFQPA